LLLLLNWQRVVLTLEPKYEMTSELIALETGKFWFGGRSQQPSVYVRCGK
jgi:hypothetical protein